ncbi:MAG: hypothetical protein JWQ63_887 [Mucilaginibacter sp.]|nr:hypothetical protein [Mucilaginibacter sp.]
MVENFKLLRYFIFGLFLLINYNKTLAQSKANGGGVQGEVITSVITHSSDGIFNSSASFTFEVKNTLKKRQSGKLSYIVTDESNKKLLTDSIQIKIGARGSDSYNFDLPKLKTGFYKINFMINVSDYDDTTRRAFGIRPEDIFSSHPKPNDFDSFWQTAKDELAKVKPEFKMTEKPELEKPNRKVYLVEMKSLDNITIRGWLTEPDSKSKNKKFPVLLGLPGYQVTISPMLGEDDDLAIFTIDVRGQGLSRDVISPRKDDFIIYNIEDRNKYVMRGVIMDCIRCIDFIYSRPELRHDNIIVSGGSMGGFLTIATAGLDNRVTLCSTQNPIMSDIYNLDGAVEWPLNTMKKFVKIKPGLTFKKVLDNLQYYDCKNFATTIKCPVLMGIGLLDPYVPPNNAYAVYNNIPGKKKMMAFKDLAHEVSIKYKEYEALWMNDTFGLF